jgi:bacterioferritin-associated ferredoxin
MYVCLCTGLNDAAIESAIKSGAKRVSEVFKHHGCKAQCGSCSTTIKDAIVCSSKAPAPKAIIPISLAAPRP